MSTIKEETREMDVRTSISLPFRRWGLPAAVVTAVLVIGALFSSPAFALTEDYGLNTESASLSNLEAGGHPEFETKFMINSDVTTLQDSILGPSVLESQPWARSRNLTVELPPGLLGNPSAFPKCETAVFLQQMSLLFGIPVPQCESDSQVGIIAPGLYATLPPGIYRSPLYNLEAPGGDSGIVARLGFFGALYPIMIDIRVDPERDYALTATISNVPTILVLTGSYNTIWGVPTESVHDNERFNPVEAITCGGPCGGPVDSGLDPTPFMSNPTSCGPAEVGMSALSYQDESGADFNSLPLGDVTDCDQVPFDPTLSLQPTTRSAATASGVDVNIDVPQDGLTDPEGLASAHLKKAVVTLPEGVSLNPSAADGLGSCTQDQIGVDRNERQIVAIKAKGAATALSFEGNSTPELPEFASAAEVQAALESLPNIAPGDVAVRGRPGGPWTVRFQGAFAGQDVPEIGGVHSEFLQLAVKAKGGTYTLTYDGETTPPIPYDADAAAVQSALEGLAGIEPGDLEVRGETGAGEVSSLIFHILFTGTLRGTDVPSIVPTESALTGVYFSQVKGPFAKVDELTQGGQQVQTETPKQGGTLGFDGEEAHCPSSSKVGSGEITTPALEERLKASLYLANQNDNPFNSLLAGYLVAEGAGARLKIAGKFDLDPGTGRIVGTFDNNPQQPFSSLELHLKGGNRGVITTPNECGTYTTSYELTPWSGNPPVKGTSQFTLDQNCGPKPFAPGFRAGSERAVAGSFTTFTTQVTNEPGAPELTGIDVDLPAGLSAKLSGLQRCPDAALESVSSATGTGSVQIASPSCPQASQVGRVSTGAGSGSPFYVNSGKVYLAGPYKGAPLSLAAVVPAVAGPFDLGSVLVRVPVTLDRRTAQVHTTSDPIPTILHGVPVEARDIRVILDRQGFVLNPTDCEAKSVSGKITGVGGASAQVSDRFQVGECSALGFKPKLSLRLKGGTKRADHPALTAILRPRPGDANISDLSVAFPRSEFLDQAHIGTVCTRVQFAADSCPAASVYGKVTATTPLLDEPLRGNVYLRSSDNELPDLVTDLRGPADLPIKLEAAGRNDSVNGGLRNTFAFIPDAPITRVVLKMRGGKKGLLQNSRDICARTFRASVSFGAHNGREWKAKVPLQARCKGKPRSKSKSRG